MKTRIISSIALLLLLSLLLGSFVACKNEETPPETGSTSEVEDTTGGEKDEYDPGEVNYGGYEYEMLTETNSKSYNLYLYLGEGVPSQVTDMALWQREGMMDAKYGVKLKLNNQKDKATALETIRNSVGSGQSSADIIMINGEYTMVIAQEGHIYDVNTLPNLNLEASYWDQRIQSEYKIGESLYCLEGDFNFADELSTFVVIYNDTFYESYGYYDTYGSPYELASQGKWTYEKMQEMIKDCASDKDGGGVMDENDIWGMVSESKLPYYILIGSGKKTLTNRDGEFTFDIKDNGWANVQDILEKGMELLINDDTIIADGKTGHYITNSGAMWDIASDIFKYNRALFRTTSLSAVTRLIDMESDYGIMPIPAYEETSPEDAAYYCWLEPYLHYPMSFPVSARDVEKTTQITEIFAYTSRYGADSLYNAFFDLLAYARLCRTGNDIEMLKLVFANKCFDMDQALGITRLLNKVADATRNNATAEGAMGAINNRFTAGDIETYELLMKEIVLNLSVNGKTYPLN